MNFLAPRNRLKSAENEAYEIQFADGPSLYRMGRHWYLGEQRVTPSQALSLAALGKLKLRSTARQEARERVEKA